MRKYSNKLIDEFERATRCEAWAGAQPAEERAGIHAEFKLAKKELEDKMRELGIGQRAKMSQLHYEVQQLKRELNDRDRKA